MKESSSPAGENGKKNNIEKYKECIVVFDSGAGYSAYRIFAIVPARPDLISFTYVSPISPRLEPDGMM